MTRMLVCRKCGDAIKPYLPSADARQGWKQRKVFVSLRNEYQCDHCLKTIRNRCGGYALGRRSLGHGIAAILGRGVWHRAGQPNS